MAKWNKRVVSTIIDRMRVTRVAGVVGKTIVRVDSSLEGCKRGGGGWCGKEEYLFCVFCAF